MKRIIFIMLAALLLLTACVPTVPSASSALTADPAAEATPSPSAEPVAASTAVPAAASSGLTKQSAPVSAPQAQLESAAIVEGIILIMDARGLDLLETRTDADGGYHETLLYDAMVEVIIERMPQATEYDHASVLRRIQELAPNAYEMDLAIDEDTSARLTYPAWKAVYLTGSNEDTRLNEELFIQTDLWDFRMRVSTPIDWYEDYKDIISFWFEVVTLDEV